MKQIINNITVMVVGLGNMGETDEAEGKVVNLLYDNHLLPKYDTSFHKVFLDADDLADIRAAYRRYTEIDTGRGNNGVVMPCEPRVVLDRTDRQVSEQLFVVLTEHRYIDTDGCKNAGDRVVKLIQDNHPYPGETKYDVRSFAECSGAY